ncbi:response regulator transcription factor [Alicyclobacillus pomorum]|jgi:DNA-binding response OmpR family regulator|uniref:response regulator transcription factor n=1 Tax=Alicyclobacillus pomorum TaxID=204470 RepID=UPI00040D846F|nr:response regulator transcription factor [Alicyclobacillus pomorum]
MNEPHRILVVEDEEDIAEFLAMEFEYEGYKVTKAFDGREGLKLALEQKWDIILLDVMLPEMNGMEVCRRVRAVSNVPIIMLTARGSVPDRVAGLDAGADDYLQKPFAIEELLARIRVLLRRNRASIAEQKTLTVQDLTMNTATREVFRQQKPITLTAREFDLLEMFMRNPNQVLSRDLLLERVWGYDYKGETNIVDVYVRYLRQKIDVPFDPPLIHTVRGVGYMLKGATSS